MVTSIGKKRGFTLIELLVVIAIIAVLAAILFPVFGAARDKAKQSACLSNLRQMASGFNLYLEDNSDSWPMLYWSYQCPTGWFPVDENKQYIGWDQMIMRYVKNRAVFICPGNPVYYSNSDRKFVPYKVTNYMYNQYLACTKQAQGTGNAAHPNAPRTTASLTKPAKTVAIMDGGMDDWARTFLCGNDGQNLPKGAQGDRAGTIPPQIKVTHNHGGQFIFADCHVSWLNVGQWKPSMWYPIPGVVP
ncbi:MAG: prepilin-type N-terminal cleavage/methylation domain-containing protein [Armatimonadetes bacterium]|nr:prepilin-type N-terminal cleavage/methylation domain-containing protein [Armatimonadota bacterium]